MLDQIIRNIQIDLILGNPNSIIDTFNDIWEGLSVCEIEVYHNDGGELIYYNKNKEWVFFQDNKSEKFWCHYSRYWSIFEDKYGLTYNDVQIVTKLLVENVLNNIVTTPNQENHMVGSIVREALSKSITTPSPIQFHKSLIVNALNRSKKFRMQVISNVMNNKYEKSKI